MERNSGSRDLANPQAGLVGAVFPIYPRRDEKLTLRVYQWTGDMGMPGEHQWVDFPFTNLAYRKYPVWSPEPFPIARNIAGLKIEMMSLSTGGEFPTGVAKARIPSMAATVASFRVTRNGVAALDWEPVELTYTDATGNRISGIEERLARNGAIISFPIYGQLPSDEVAWKVRAEFSQFRQPQIKPDHIWFAYQFPVVSTNEWFQRRTLPLGPDVELETELFSSSNGGQRTLNLRLKGKGIRNSRFRVRGETEYGSKLENINDGLPPDEGTPDWQVMVPATASTVDLMFSGYKSRIVEFYARPTRVN
jgi:hypothetical protein